MNYVQELFKNTCNVRLKLEMDTALKSHKTRHLPKERIYLPVLIDVMFIHLQVLLMDGNKHLQNLRKRYFWYTVYAEGWFFFFYSGLTTFEDKSEF